MYDICPMFKGVNQMLISRNMGQDAVRSVNSRTEQDTVFLFWDKGLTNKKATLFQTDRNILQVGIHAGQTACLRQILYIAGMDLPIFQNPILKTDDIGRLDLVIWRYSRILDTIGAMGARRSEDINSCGIAGFGLLRIFKREFNFSKRMTPIVLEN